MLRALFVAIALLLAPMALSAPINVNTATAAELDALPGIGPSKAQAIVEWREGHGPFTTVDQLEDVPGIGPSTLTNIRGFVTIDGSEPPGIEIAAPGPAPTPAPKAAPAAAVTTSPTAASTGVKVNINTASAAELDSLPGIGATKAQAIIEDREANGPFATCADLARVAGIGPATVQSIADRCVTR
jgi:competence protein ComEA